MTHRGAIGSDKKTGDGCGLLFDLNHNFLNQHLNKEQNISTPNHFAVAMIFHSKKLEAYLNQINKIFNDEDLELFATSATICIRQDFKEKFTKYFSNLYYLYR